MYDSNNPSYEMIHNAMFELWGKISGTGIKPNKIVGVARGGLIPAVMMSHQSGISFQAISYSSTEGAGDNKNHANALPDVDGKVLLIVDDICDTSLTLHDIVTHYQTRGHVVYTAVLHYKTRVAGKHIPDFYWKKVPENGPWIVYPFERREPI